MRFALVGICRNEARFLREWLVYHRLVGFEHAYLGINDPPGSVGYVATLAAIRPFVEEGFVTPVDWPDRPGGRGQVPAGERLQVRFYRYVVARYGALTEFMATLDIDEFFVTSTGEQVGPVLDRHYSSPDISDLRVYWKLFGPSVERRLIGLQIELTRYAPPPDSCITMTKTLFRPDRVLDILTPHWIEPLPGNRSLLPEVGDDPFSMWRPFAIYHYLCRSVEDFAEKVALGRLQGLRYRSPEQRWKDFYDCAEQAVLEDRSLAGLAGRTRAELARYATEGDS